ncbi:VOC family protein [Amycolatopsis sp.]|uniref:VOC family protein n=1 Tax=Amycolatopsis sp. TaxID=37632 RepID=UPI002C05B853|nr:VOC family protein [Amycolatopsis sp.]HVV14367.1 VOC family protein [Amycolatopsis sp.]
MTRITQVRTIGVPVADQDRALDFYVGRLGFEKRLDVSYGDRWVEVAPPGSETTIALVRSETPGVDTGIRLTTADAGGDHAELRGHGVDVDAEVLHWQGVPPMFGLRDPDGNRLVLIELTNRT